MLPGQQEAGLGMIEVGRLPRRGVMAVGTGLGETVLDVIGIACPFIVGLMAAVAVIRRAGVATGVTGDTGLRGMRAGQWESGLVVVKRRGLPGGGVVTIGAVLGEVVLDVIGIGCPDKVILMAAVTIGRRSGIAVGVAGHTILRYMGSG